MTINICYRGPFVLFKVVKKNQNKRFYGDKSMSIGLKKNFLW